jgi:hypothetical protein
MAVVTAIFQKRNMWDFGLGSQVWAREYWNDGFSTYVTRFR